MRDIYRHLSSNGIFFINYVLSFTNSLFTCVCHVRSMVVNNEPITSSASLILCNVTWAPCQIFKTTVNHNHMDSILSDIFFLFCMFFLFTLNDWKQIIAAFHSALSHKHWAFLLVRIINFLLVRTQIMVIFHHRMSACLLI